MAMRIVVKTTAVIAGAGLLLGAIGRVHAQDAATLPAATSGRGEQAPVADDAAASPAAGADAGPLPTLAVAPLDGADARGALPVQNEKPGRIAEILVTARRVAESQQEVPIAITTMSAADLQREAINSPQDLQGRVPSLVVSTSSQMRNTESPAIRGQGQDFGTSPGVIIYFAEVPLPGDPIASNQGGPGKFLDLSDIQILKGSQGTLFGRNTTGGAMLLEPTRPKDAIEGSLRAEYTSYSGQGYEGVFNTPLFSDRLLLRAAAKYFDRDGFTHDVVTGKDYDNKHFWTGRLGLTWRPFDPVENYLVGYYTDSQDNGTGAVIEDINREELNQGIAASIGLGVLSQIPGLDLSQTANLGCLVLDTFGPSKNCGQDILDEQHARGDRHVQLSADPDDILKTGGVIDQLNVDITDEMRIRNIASYSTFKHHYRWDIDGSRAAFTDYNPDDDHFEADLDNYTEELQLQGTSLNGLLRFALGGYYEHANIDGYSQATALFIQSVLAQYQMTKESYAPYAQGTLDLGYLADALSGLSLTAGARYTTDKTHIDATFVQTALGTLKLVDDAFSNDIKDSAPTYTVGLDYKFGANLVYGKVSRGYKTGGEAPDSVNPDHRVYKPEYVTNYEIGQKSDFEMFGMPARLNTSAYYTDYSDLQKSATDTYLRPNAVNLTPTVGVTVYNVGKASIAGFELEGTLKPTDSLTLIATYGYTKAEYKKFDLLIGDILPHLDCTGTHVQKGNVADLHCVPVQNTPRNQFSVSARYLWPFDPSYGDIESSLTYAWTDRRYGAQTTLPEDEPGSWLPAYGLLNGSIHWDKIFGSAFDVQLYGTNLTNEKYRLSNSSIWHLTFFRSSVYSEPRIIGVQMGYRWGQ
ncbi:TonB-dependent receptor [Solimonas terrae]|uniref:TonB-dependent receptor n=1 Tax=Solimonas terrae TaxID=1396819 RepID=A0A6M2BW99_9GAMM|nr:TonB-dependent receptor plug domain-containing protein [Solimonas terrae]NGY06259.1 TonB-dependent receptor [Solimonas terrae]